MLTLLALLLPLLQRVALDWELMDRRERQYVLARPEDLGGDLRLLYRRLEEQAAAPPLDDSYRFPERTLVSDVCLFNRHYRQHLIDLQALNPERYWELRESIQETDDLYRVWDLARDARCPYFYVTIRRQALKSLREALGDAAYYAGEMPPCVPVWRFSGR
jgi:hypothetical protein